MAKKDQSQTFIERANYRTKETTTLVLEADNASFRGKPDGGMVLELFRYGDNGKPVESFRFHISAEDRARFKTVA